jgi:hypothetical protein
VGVRVRVRKRKRESAEFGIARIPVSAAVEFGCLVLIWYLGCVCQSENDAVWGGFSTFALEPALSSPTFPKLQGGLHMNTSSQTQRNEQPSDIPDT